MGYWPSVIFSNSAEQTYKELESEAEKRKVARSLVRAVHHKIEFVKEDPRYGDAIEKQNIPAKYKEAGITNLFRVELPQFWRLLYTISSEENKMKIIITDILDHENYNKLFGYKKH